MVWSRNGRRLGVSESEAVRLRNIVQYQSLELKHKFVILQEASHDMENCVSHPEWVRAFEDAAVWLRNQ